MKKLIYIIFLFLLFIVGQASWVYIDVFDTGKYLDLHNDLVNVTVHEIMQTTSTETVTKYYVPDVNKVVVDESKFISETNKEGKTEIEKYGDVGSRWKTVDWDEKNFYYNICGENYNKIVTHDSTGPSQIKYRNENTKVNGWIETNDSNSWGKVWDVGFGSYKFYFYDTEEDSVSFKRLHDKGSILIDTGVPIYDSGEIIDEINNTVTTEKIYERCIVRDYKELKRGTWLFFSYKYGFYYPTYEYRKVVTTQTLKSTKENISSRKVSLKKGSLLNKVDLKINNYEQAAFFKDSECSSFFDFSDPINNDIDIYVKYFESNNNNLSSKIESLNANESLYVYDQYKGGTSNSNLTYDIYTDPYYNSTNNVCFLPKTNIKINTNVNLTYGNCLSYQEPIEGAITDNLGNHRTKNDDSISEEYENNAYVNNKNSSVYVALQGDMTVNGTLTIGAHLGSNNSYTKYSYIIGKYAVLDLYGNNIYVDGGVINAYGVIKDSVGGGKIYIRNNGKINATLTVTDGRSTRQMMLGVSKRQTPFSMYAFSYLRVPVNFVNGTAFNAYLKFDIGEFGLYNFLFGFIGNDKSLFLRNDDDKNAFIDYIPEFNNILINNDAKANFYNLRNKFIFSASVIQNYKVDLSMKITLSLGSASTTIDFGRIDFPISCFFDFVLTNKKIMTIKSMMTFYPGSSLIVLSGSTLRFSYSGKVKYEPVTGINIAGEERFLVGGLMSYSNNISKLAKNGPYNEQFNLGIYNSTDYWQYNKYSDINIYGNIEFDSTLNTSAYKNDAYYLMSGYINISNNSLISLLNSKSLIKTYDFKAELNNGFLFEGTDVASKYQFERATSYNLNPLISNGIAYVVDKNYSLKGKFENGLFKCKSMIQITDNGINSIPHDKNYFLYTDTDMYEDGSLGKNQDSRIDREIVIKEVTGFNNNNSIILSNNEKYAYYKGIYVPINNDVDIDSININDSIYVNLRKFMSNSETVKDENSSKYNNCIITLNSNKEWIFKTFA